MLVGERCQHDDGLLGVFGQDAPCRFEATGVRHPLVEDDDVGPSFPPLGDRVLAVDRLAGDTQAGVSQFGQFERRPQEGTHVVLVVGDQDAHIFGDCGTPSHTSHGTEGPPGRQDQNMS